MARPRQPKTEWWVASSPQASCQLRVLVLPSFFRFSAAALRAGNVAINLSDCYCVVDVFLFPNVFMVLGSALPSARPFALAGREKIREQKKKTRGMRHARPPQRTEKER